jgi:hypothetical protein
MRRVKDARQNFASVWPRRGRLRDNNVSTPLLVRTIAADRGSINMRMR